MNHIRLFLSHTHRLCVCLLVYARIRLKDVQLAPGLAPLNPNANVIFVTCKKITAELGATKTDEESA